MQLGVKWPLCKMGLQIERAVFHASGHVACVPCLRPLSPFRSWSVMAGMILCVYKHFIWMKHQTGKKQFLPRTCHAILVTRTGCQRPQCSNLLGWCLIPV